MRSPRGECFVSDPIALVNPRRPRLSHTHGRSLSITTACVVLRAHGPDPRGLVCSAVICELNILFPFSTWKVKI